MDMHTHGIVGQIARVREAANLLIERELKARQMAGIVPDPVEKAPESPTPPTAAAEPEHQAA